MHNLFVYGTLRSDASSVRAGFLDQFCGEPQYGFIAGEIADLGSYPGLFKNPNKGVRGQVYTLPENPAQVLDMCDSIEGTDFGLYRRESVVVTLESGEEVEAWVYFYGNQNTRRRIEIPEGDWIEYCRKNQYE